MNSQNIHQLTAADQKLYQLGLNFPGTLTKDQYKQWAKIHERCQNSEHYIHNKDLIKIAIMTFLGWLLVYLVAGA